MVKLLLLLSMMSGKKIQKQIMNNEQQQIIDEVYEKYALSCIKETKKQEKEMKEKGEWLTLCLTPYFENKDKFVELIKTESNFSEKWELKIEERILNWEERRDIASKTMDSREFNGYYDNEKEYWVGFGHISPFTDFFINYWLDEKKIPKKIITITYKDKTIESYE